jgi:hypothetical protein
MLTLAGDEGESEEIDPAHLPEALESLAEAKRREFASDARGRGRVPPLPLMKLRFTPRAIANLRRDFAGFSAKQELLWHYFGDHNARQHRSDLPVVRL